MHQPNFTGRSIVFTIDATEKSDAERVEYLAQHVIKNGGKVACFISESTPKELQEYISSKFHSHIINLKNPDDVQRWLNTANTNLVANNVYYIKTIASPNITVSGTRVAGTAGGVVAIGTKANANITATAIIGTDIWKRIELTSW